MFEALVVFGDEGLGADDARVVFACPYFSHFFMNILYSKLTGKAKPHKMILKN